jgi:hypothetical protein
MAINKNHEFEELDGVKCGIVEKNVSQERADFLKDLLEYNRYVVIIVPSPPPKVVPAPKTDVAIEPDPLSETPRTFTVGVSDYTFNPVNAIYGRMLKTQDGHFVTPAYWQQKETVSHDDVPYYEKKF